MGSNNRLFYHNCNICLQDSSRAIFGILNFIKLTYIALNLCNVCNKNMCYIYKQIKVSVKVSLEYKAANTNVQVKNDMLVLFSIARYGLVVTV